MNFETQLNDIIDTSKSASDSIELKKSVFQFLRNLPSNNIDLDIYRSCLELIKQIDVPGERSFSLTEFINIVTQSEEAFPVIIDAAGSVIDAAQSIDNLKHKKSTILRLADSLPDRPELMTLYLKVMSLAIDVTDKVDDDVERRIGLVNISNKLRNRPQFEALSLHAMRVCLGLSKEAGYEKYSLPLIAKGLPKMCDYKFYRNNTFFGVTLALPKKGEFLKLYKEAIEIAIEASDLIEEAFYKKYALFFIAEALPKTDDFLPLYKKTLSEALNAVLAMNDPFARQYALIEILQEFPKTPEFSSQILRTIENILPFFTFQSRVSDMEIIDVFDYLIVVEEKKLKDSKKKMYSREKIARLFSAELEKLTMELNDIRLLEMLKPYAHVWARPKVLRDTVRKVIAHVEALMKEHHGREVERPIAIKESFFDIATDAGSGKKSQTAVNTLAIDLGATNTVIMRKLWDGEPDYLPLNAISKKYGDYNSIPTLINPETGEIGTEALKRMNYINIKKMLLEGDPRGKELMERYFRSLYEHIKSTQPQKGLLSRLGSKVTERICVTVPVGFIDYGKAIHEIVKDVTGSGSIDIVEEPLTAAIGYNVAENRDKLVIVFDFGGCTLDIMLLRLNVDRVHVVAKPDRSKMLGGRDVDSWLAEYLAEVCGLAEDDISYELLEKAEAIKVSLSDYKTVPFEWEGRKVCDVTRETFEEILSSHGFYNNVDRAISYVLRKAKKVGIEKEMVEEVLLTGGASLIPSFKAKIAHTFPHLAEKNAIYDHSPLTAVVKGATIYGTKDVIDRHLGMAYALRYKSENKKDRYSYEILLEKGMSLPFEKTFRMKPARTLGVQSEIYVELYEVPEALIARRWVKESGKELIRQYLKQSEKDVELKALKIVTITFNEPLEETVDVAFCIDENRKVKVKCEKEGIELDTDLSLQ
ncbi:MAG: Hsp70 family protein [Proteobacteria bacterium]|nr:Hsp70 family protein [Pseudomonadota bacterium]